MLTFSDADVEVWPAGIYISVQEVEQSETGNLARILDERTGRRADDVDAFFVHAQLPIKIKPSQQGGLQSWLIRFRLRVLLGQSIPGPSGCRCVPG